MTSDKNAVTGFSGCVFSYLGVESPGHLAQAERRRDGGRDVARQAKGSGRPLIYTCRGFSLTARQWAEKQGIPLRVLKYRIFRKWPLEQALGFEARKGPRPSRARYLTYKGETLTISEWEARTGQPVDRISQRIASGWCLGEALGLEKHVHKSKGQSRAMKMSGVCLKEKESV